MADETIQAAISTLTKSLFALTHVIAMQPTVDPRKLLADWHAIMSSVDELTPLDANIIGKLAGSIDSAARVREAQSKRGGQPS